MARLQPFAPLRSALLAASAALAGAWSAPALATEATVPPLVGSGVDPLIVLNMTSLISSEMDFMGEFDGVKQLDQRPGSLNARCLGSASCLGGIAKTSGTDALVAGAVASKGNKFDLYLVYYDGGQIVRTKEYTVVNVPSVIADSMGGYVRELVTGESPAAQAAVAAGGVDEDFFDTEEDDFAMAVVPTGGNSRRIPTSGSSSGNNELDDFDFDADPQDEARKKREEEERQRAAALAAQREREAEQRRQREEEQRRQAEEEERRRAAALAAQRQREEEERQAAAAAAEEDEDDDLVFGDADITFAPVPMQLEDEPPEDEDDDVGGVAMLGLDDDGGRSTRRERPAREPRERPVREPRERPEREPRERSSYRDLDESNSRTKSRSDDGEAPTAVAAARIGYAAFQGLNFVTYGAEVSFLATDHLAILAGVEAYSTQRAMPEELQERGAPATVWNTILPFNLGLAYRFLTGNIQPYAGGDFVMIPGYVKDTGGLATGLRLRGGSDFLVTDNFGFNLNLSVGMWAGQNFESVATDTNSAALTPQFSGGTVLHF